MLKPCEIMWFMAWRSLHKNYQQLHYTENIWKVVQCISCRGPLETLGLQPRKSRFLLQNFRSHLGSSGSPSACVFISHGPHSPLELAVGAQLRRNRERLHQKQMPRLWGWAMSAVPGGPKDHLCSWMNCGKSFCSPLVCVCVCVKSGVLHSPGLFRIKIATVWFFWVPHVWFPNPFVSTWGMRVVLHGQHLQGLWWWAMPAVPGKCQDHRVLLCWTGPGLRNREPGDVQGKGTSESMWGSVPWMSNSCYWAVTDHIKTHQTMADGRWFELS